MFGQNSDAVVVGRERVEVTAKAFVATGNPKQSEQINVCAELQSELIIRLWRCGLSSPCVQNVLDSRTSLIRKVEFGVRLHLLIAERSGAQPPARGPEVVRGSCGSGPHKQN